MENRYFKALERAVEAEWGLKPLRIREGGVSSGFSPTRLRPDRFAQSIPSIPFLEKEFSCPALHFPMGQSSVGVPSLLTLHKANAALGSSTSFR